MSELLLSVDQGTTNTKAMLVERTGRVVFRTSVPVDLHFPQPGFVEAAPEDLWQSVVSCLAECAHFAWRQTIVGVSISNQRETALMWERGTGRARGPAISWQCRRSAAICEKLAEHANEFRERCGLPLDPLVSAGKWAWAFAQDDALRREAERGDLCLGTVDSWLLFKLTGGAVHACDHTNGSRTGLMNLRAAAWDRRLLDWFGIPLAALPRLLSSSGIFGLIHDFALLEGVPIVAAIGDSHAALAGHRATQASAGRIVKATYGTGSSLMTEVASLGAADARLAETVAWSTADSISFAIEGNITMSGAAVQWAGRFLGLADPLAQTLALADTVANSGGVVFVPAMAGLGAPWWRTNARGAIMGLEAASTSAHLARAAVEAIALQVCDVFFAMEDYAGSRTAELCADGGATGNDGLMQFQADMLGRQLLRAGCEDLSALGAAWLGGLALGWWDRSTPFAETQPAQRFSPRMPQAQRERHLSAWHRAIQATLLEGASR